jgi:hypothetical protein
MLILSGGAVGILLLCCSAAAPASSSTAQCANQAPCNDNYLDSLELNQAGTKLNRTNTLEDMRNTSTATVQADIFNPPASGGPKELTSCDGTGYGRTIWYDFYPDAAGTVSIRTSAFFQNVIALYTFDDNQQSPSYLVPTEQQCTVSSLGSGQLIASVKKGVAYTFQLGGADSAQAPTGAGGQLEMRFDFFPTPPRRLGAQSTLTARATSGGIELLSLSVSTARAAKVSVSCGRFCGPESKKDSATETFPHLHGAQLPAGSTLSIHVTAPHSIGVLIEYHVTRGNFSKQTFCTEPGSRKPRTKCH